ncbi:MAG TPA: hypothetical protein RMH99_14045 [Sandaracinaceae bacterium LLY-WYZ-13_1]|nr:hypothetical protein [Sandaracinaceae bacterium LLY-WYZ-13_1]
MPISPTVRRGLQALALTLGALRAFSVALRLALELPALRLLSVPFFACAAVLGLD